MTSGQTGPSRVPTSWATVSPVSVDAMSQLRDFLDDFPDVPHGWINQFLYMAWLYGQIEHLDGDIVECGLGEGNTFAMLYDCVGHDIKGASRILWGFDSFEGWPEPDPSDASPRNPTKGEWKVSEEMVTRRLEESGLYEAFDVKSRIVKGFLRDTLPEFPHDRQIAFVHLDVDLYEGYRDGLEYLFPLVVPGGIVAFDEYQEYHPELEDYMKAGNPPKWPGADKAINEYFKGRPEKIQYYAPTNKYYVVKQ